jgi:RNA polymerase sigma factor (sigma-70 family)
MGYLHSFLSRHRGEQDDDRELLRRFAESRDNDAFAALLQRHGPMVLGLARRVVGDGQLAEDVFQATFLMLSRKVDTIRRAESLSCWLHGVAFRLALRVHRAHQRRQECEARVRRASPATPLDEVSAQEFLTVLDEELRKLPENYRAVLILCCLEGLSQEEAAKRLGCSAGAVKGRLERGRNQLRLRLEKRGLTLPAVLGGTLLIAGSTNAVAAALIQSTLKAAATGAGATPAVAALIQETMRTMFLNKLKLVCAAVVLAAVTGTGAGMMALRSQAAKENAPPASAVSTDKPLSPDKRVDLYGDPLPDGAVMRLGTLQRRAVGAQIAVTADGKSIVSVRGGRYVCIWDAATGKLRQRRELPSEFRGQSSLSPDGRWLAIDTNRGDTLALWDVQSGKVFRNLTVKDVIQFNPVVFSSDGKRIAAVGVIGNERSLRVWDVETGHEVWRKHFATNHECEQLAFSSDGKRLLVSLSSNDEGMSCWDLAKDRLVWQNKEFRPYMPVRVTPNNKILSHLPQMPVVDLATGRPVKVENFPRINYDMSFAVSPDGRTLLLSTVKGTIVWDMVQGKEVRSLSGADGDIVFLPDGKAVLVNNGSLQRWELATGKPLWSDTFEQGHVGEVLVVAISADGRRLASASADGSLRLWDIKSGKPLRVWRGHDARRTVFNFRSAGAGVKALDITPDGRWLLSTGSSEGIKLWDASRDNEVRSLRLPPAAKGELYRKIIRLRISPDGTRALALFAPSIVAQTPGQLERKPAHKLATWDAKTGELLTCPVVEVKDARLSAIAPGGRTLLVDGRFVDAASGREVGRLQNPVLAHSFQPPPSTPYVFSADGALVLSSFLDRDPATPRLHGGARLWETATGKEISEVAVPALGQIAFHPDNRFLVTNQSQSIQIRNASTGMKVVERKMPEQVWSSDSWYRYASCFAVTPDGRRLATGMPDSTILLWDISLPSSKPQRLEAKELEALWADLADADAAKAWRAVWRLADAPNDALTFLRGRVKPSPTAPADVTRKLLADLDDSSFEVREAAGKRLKALGLQAEPALRAAVEAKPSLEQRRRIEELLAALPIVPRPPSMEELRQLRALIVLERIGSPEARRMLEEVAKGPQSARLTRQALAALACMR